MAIEGLTQQQSDFVERFLKVPKVFNRKAMKQKRKEAAEQFRLFNAEHDLLREELASVSDPELRSVLLAQLRAAEAIIERDPKNLDFEGGQKQLEDVRNAMMVHIKKDDALRAHAALEKAMADLDIDHAKAADAAGADTQSDIALTWDYVQEKFASGTGTNNLKDIEAALKAMGRLDGMLKVAKTTAMNPFEARSAEAAGVKDAAREGLDPKVLEARRSLSDTYTRMVALRDKLNAQFGADHVPLDLQMACTTIQKKLADATDAPPDKLVELADDADAAYDVLQSNATKRIAQALEWDRDHAAFGVRYDVMLAHPFGKDATFVKPEFDKIKAAYAAAAKKALEHEYKQACLDLAVVRNDLKDALDFADDFANYRALLAERKALLATLPAAYALPSLQTDHQDALELLNKAETAHQAGQMQAALGHLNAIPKAVADILEKNRFAATYKKYHANWKSWHDGVAAEFPAKVKALVAADFAYSAKIAKEAEDNADAGNYRRASGRMLDMTSYASKMYAKAKMIQSYLDEKAEFIARRRETRARRGPEGREAIESYYQELVGDEAKRAKAEAAGDFQMANAMCLRLKTKHAEMMALADDAKAYLAKKKEFETERAKLSGAKSADATKAKAAADQMLADAVASTIRGNWKGAENLLDGAILEIKRAVSDVETAALIDGHQGGIDGLKITSDTEFAGVYASFSQILQHVRQQDAQGLFTAELNAADAKAKSADKMIATDPGGAETTLNQAIEACRKIAFQLSAAASYAAQLATTKAIIIEVEAANVDSVIDAEIKTAKDERTAAENAAKAPGHDFDAAVNHLAMAQGAARLGLDAAATYKDTVKDARTKMTEAITEYKDPAVSPHLDAHAARLQKVLDDMNSSFATRKLTEASTLAAKGEELAALHGDVCKACEKAIDLIEDPDLEQTGIEMTHPATTQEAIEIKAMMDAAAQAFAAGSFKVSYKIAMSGYWAMMDARAKATAFDTWLPFKIECKDKLEALETRAVPEAGPGHEAVQTLRKSFDAAIEQEKLDNFAGAQKRLASFSADCTAASDLLDVYDRYVLHKTRAQAALDKVRQLNSPAIETLLGRLEGKDRNADRKGQGFDFAVGTSLYAELEAECKTARETANTLGEVADSVSEIKVIADQDTDDLKAAIAKAQVTLKGLMAQPSAMYVLAETQDCKARLKQAEDSVATDFATARSEVEAAIDVCVQMILLLAQYDQLNDSALTAKRIADELLVRAPEVDILRDEINQRMLALDTAMVAARSARSNRAQTQKEVEDTIATLRDMRKTADAQKQYLGNREEVMRQLSDLEKDQNRHLIREDLTEVRKLLDTAATRAADRNHPSAEAELKKALLRLDMARLRAKLATNTKPDPAEIKAILNAPGGIDQLDSMIDTLEASVQREVMAVAFEARFGCKLELKKPGATKDTPLDEDRMDLPAANIRRFYKEMAKLPPSNTLDNDSMIVFDHVSGKQTGSAYDGEDKVVLMREGDEATSHIYSIALEHEIGDIDPDAKPKDGEARTAFSWNTLHEVGHAVDDKLGYMKKHGERLAGWKVYGSNVREPAGIIAQHFDFDADYVAEYMMSKAGRKLPMPDPVGCDVAEWHRRMEECRMFVDRAREGNSPWSSASIAAACTIGDYTYVESYKGDWARYRTDQRKYAVSGYQFRAPGEWFSELYAAMATDRLNDNHPHRDEIKKICVKEDA